MIVHKQHYYEWIQQQGVGLKDKIASSPDSYISYLNSVSELLLQDVSPSILSTEEDVLAIARELESRKAPNTIRNYKSAMRQYVAMVHALRLNDRSASTFVSASDADDENAEN